jgi:protein TonB
MAKKLSTQRPARGLSEIRRPLNRVRAIILGAALSFGIFILVPFTQMLSGLKPQDKTVRSFDVVQPPPPPPPELEEPPEEPPPEEPPPEMTPPPPPMSLTQLELALNPGIGDALAGVGGFEAFALSPDAALEAQLFDVQDLDELPRPIRQVRMEPPTRFRQERISGLVRVEIMIDEEGRTTVRRIIESSHSDLVDPAREALRQWVWSPPKKNGDPVKARYILPIGFRF